MHQLNASDLPHTVQFERPFIHSATHRRGKKFWLHYTVLLWYMGLGKKNFDWHSTVKDIRLEKDDPHL